MKHLGMTHVLKKETSYRKTEKMLLKQNYIFYKNIIILKINIHKNFTICVTRITDVTSVLETRLQMRGARSIFV